MSTSMTRARSTLSPTTIILDSRLHDPTGSTSPPLNPVVLQFQQGHALDKPTRHCSTANPRKLPHKGGRHTSYSRKHWIAGWDRHQARVVLPDTSLRSGMTPTSIICSRRHEPFEVHLGVLKARPPKVGVTLFCKDIGSGHPILFNIGRTVSPLTSTAILTSLRSGMTSESRFLSDTSLRSVKEPTIALGLPGSVIALGLPGSVNLPKGHPILFNIGRTVSPLTSTAILIHRYGPDLPPTSIIWYRPHEPFEVLLGVSRSPLSQWGYLAL
ncbi:hypothetical protein DFS34DRAFT_324292 [Phlyctochytrium arcticum]|nr:hypothetical protein DFS34DRAFT_324292 [Phlyctochytrium arcticum]